MPDQGESILSLGQGFKPPAPLAHLAFTGEFFNSPAFIAPPFFRPTFAQDLPVNQANAMNAAQRPINAPILGTPSGPVAWHDLPSWYAVSGADLPGRPTGFAPANTLAPTADRTRRGAWRAA